MKLLSTPAFRELDASENRRIIGGAIPWLPILFGAAVYNVVNHWDHFKQGLSGSPEEPEN